MGVVNVTPDSFSDGGQWLAPDVAIAHGRHLAAQGADLIDVGGESTRPGAERVSLDLELQRVLPVVSGLAALDLAVTIDTMRAEVADAALQAGAWGVNDVSGGLTDQRMLDVVAAHGCPVILGHWGAHARDAAEHNDGADVVADVGTELMARAEQFRRVGVAADRIVIDPVLGFSKNAEQNWRLLAGLPTLMSHGYPVLIGASRKQFLGELLAKEGSPSLPSYRDRATAAVSALAAAQGVWGVRVHDVAGSVDAVRVAAALTDVRTASAH